MKIDRIQMLDMAINMLNQAKSSQQAIEKIVDNNDLSLLGFGDKKGDVTNGLWGKYIYSIIRGAVGLMEITTSDIERLAEAKCVEQEEEEREYDD